MGSPLMRGYVISLIGIVFWSLSGVIMSALLRFWPLPALTLALWRNILTFLILGPILLVTQRKLLSVAPELRGLVLLNGLILTFFNSFWAVSVAANGAAVATVLAYSSVGYTVIAERLIFREALTRAKLTAVVLSIGGTVLVSGAYRPELWQLEPVGLFSGLLCGVMFAVYALYGKAAAGRGLSSWTTMFYGFALSTPPIALLALVPGLPGGAGTVAALWPQLTADGWLLLAALVLGPTLLGFGLFSLSLSYLPAGIANLLATLEPVLTALEAYVWLAERLDAAQLIGSALILAAVLMVRPRSEPQITEEQP